MPTLFGDSSPVIRGLGLMELRSQFGGESPMVWAKFAYLDAGGHSMGQVVTNHMSPRSRELLAALEASLETDFIEFSSTELHDREKLQDTYEDDVTYPAP